MFSNIQFTIFYNKFTEGFYDNLYLNNLYLICKVLYCLQRLLKCLRLNSFYHENIEGLSGHILYIRTIYLCIFVIFLQ